MTFPELLALGKACLIEYEPRFKLLGKKPWDASANGSLCWHGPGPLSILTEQEMKGIICAILNRLAALDGFIMSGPRYADIEGVYQTVLHNNLSLTFADAHDTPSDLDIVRINCWYYPVP
jgi:hypothetical protein